MNVDFSNFGLFLSGLLACIALLRIGILSFPEWVYFILDIRAPVTQQQRFVEPQREEPEVQLTNDPNKEWGLLRLKEFHNQLNKRLDRINELLFEREINKALEALKFFRNQLRIQIAEENDIVIPLFINNAPFSETKKKLYLDMFPLEDRKLLSHLDQAINKLNGMSETNSKKTSDLLEILDCVSQFKHLLARHDSREVKEIYLGAEHELSEAQLRNVWNQCYAKRQEMNFRLGTMKSLTKDKIQTVISSWEESRGKFADTIANLELTKTLPFSDSEMVQGFHEGAGELKLIDDIVGKLNTLDGKTIMSIRQFLPHGFGINDWDNFIGIVLESLKHIQGDSFTPVVREAWANALNVVLTA